MSQEPKQIQAKLNVEVLNACGTTVDSFLEDLNVIGLTFGKEVAESVREAGCSGTGPATLVRAKASVTRKVEKMDGFAKVVKQIRAFNAPTIGEPSGEWFQLALGAQLRSVASLAFEVPGPKRPLDLVLNGNAAVFECKSVDLGYTLVETARAQRKVFERLRASGVTGAWTIVVNTPADQDWLNATSTCIQPNGHPQPILPTWLAVSAGTVHQALEWQEGVFVASMLLNYVGNTAIPGMFATDDQLSLVVHGPLVDEGARIEQKIVDKARQAVPGACNLLAVSLPHFAGDSASLDARIAQALAGSAARFDAVALFQSTLEDAGLKTMSRLVYGTDQGKAAVPAWLHAALDGNVHVEPSP
jgi:hypothetical protein